MTEEFQGSFGPAISGEKVRRRTKVELARSIAELLDLEPPVDSRGSSVDSTFLDRIHTALTGDSSAGSDAYRKLESVLRDLGLTYDPFWDSSESAEAGGSTVTTRAYSRIHVALTGIPRCFLFNVTDAQSGARWETDHQQRYRYDGTVTGRGPLNDAGPGSRIIYYSTSRSRRSPKHFVAHAVVSYIGPGWQGPWEAAISDYSEFATPVPKSELSLPGWNHQHAITEITHETYAELLRRGGSEPGGLAAPFIGDPGGDVVAKRVIEELSLPEAPPTVAIPDVLPHGAIQLSPPATPRYKESGDGEALHTLDLPPSHGDSARNKLAEQRAVDLTTSALVGQGWVLERDCQKDGVGYDLRFVNGTRELHVEVKGILGSTLAFNLTPKESWRAETDPDFVIVAVTNVLSPSAFRLRLLTRADLVGALRTITGYRLTMSPR